MQNPNNWMMERLRKCRILCYIQFPIHRYYIIVHDISVNHEAELQNSRILVSIELNTGDRNADKVKEDYKNRYR